MTKIDPGVPEVHEEQGLQGVRGQVRQRLCQVPQGEQLVGAVTSHVFLSFWADKNRWIFVPGTWFPVHGLGKEGHA